MKPNNPPTILIAGGAGYIGSHANKILNKRGFETVVYGNLSRGHREFTKWGHLFWATFLAAAHLLALEYLQSGAPSDAFNLGNSNGFSVKEVIHAVERVTGKSIKVVEAKRRPGDPPILVGSADKARQILGWQQQYTSLDEIIKTALHWQSHAKKC